MTWDFYTALIVINLMWLCWLVIWVIASQDVKKSVYRQPAVERAIFLVLIIVGIIIARHLPYLEGHIFPPTPGTEALGALLTAAGLGWAIWARRHLGRNWSGFVTIKEDHEVVQTGPYTITRHPIYTGILLAVFGSLFALMPSYGGALCVSLALVGFAIKLHQEERALLKHFPQAYGTYKQHVRAALVPYLL